MRKFLTVLFVVFSYQFALAWKCCFCEVGDWPANQTKFFLKGCQIWMSFQKGCDRMELIPQNTNYNDLNLTCSKVSIGFVGHWESSAQTVGYLFNSIVPLMRSLPVSVDLDNTACKAMEDPEQVRDYVHSLKLSRDQKLNIKGNQVDSIGKWDVILGPTYNFWAKVSSGSLAIEFPRCNRFEGRPCLTSVQYHQTARCTTTTNQISTLKCCAVEDTYGEGVQRKIVWADPKECTTYKLTTF